MKKVILLFVLSFIAIDVKPEIAPITPFTCNIPASMRAYWFYIDRHSASNGLESGCGSPEIVYTRIECDIKDLRW